MKELFQEDEAIKQELANEADEEPENEASSFGISVSFVNRFSFCRRNPKKRKQKQKQKQKLLRRRPELHA